MSTVLTPIGEMIVDTYASRGLAYDYHYQFTKLSSNSKIGPIPCTVTEKRSCPDSCPSLFISSYSNPIHIFVMLPT